MVTFRTDAAIAEIEAAGARVLETYPSYTVARGTAGSISVLQAEGRYAESLAGSGGLDLLTGSVDVATLASRPPVAWSIDDRGQTVGVVHFYAPIKEQWKESIQAHGLTVLRYLPQDAFVVRGSPADFASLSLLAPVDWVGAYDPAWKVRSGIADVGIADVSIVVFPGEYPEAIEAWLGHHGIPLASRAGSDPVILGAFGSGDFRWVRARIPASLIASLAALPSVEFIDLAEPVHAMNAETDWVLQTNTSGLYRYWTYGLDARGQVIGMSDTGLDYDGNSFRQSASTIVLGDIYNVTDATRRKVVRYLNMGVLTGALSWLGGGGIWDPASMQDCPNGHGTGVASTLAGNDNGIGTSPNDGNALLGKIYLEDVGGLQGTTCPNEGLIYVPENYDNLFGPPGLVYNDPIAPVRIQSNSWGANTNVYDLQARMVDAFVWAHPDMTILFAAGNAGSTAGSVGTPATAKDIVTVGGADNPDAAIPGAQNDLATQSSRGPTTDGRIKPTIVTIFDGDSAMSDGNPLSGTGAPDLHWAGTSYSTPAAAAAAAIIRQYFVDGWYPAGRAVSNNSMNPSAALIRAMLIASGVQVTGMGIPSRSSLDTWPNNEQGFGRVLLSKVLPIAAAGDTFRTQVVDGTTGLLTGDNATYTFHSSTAGPAKFVLTWTDFPGTLGATKVLVNDLDLQVTAPDGTVYRGNHFAPFAQGESLPGGSFDTTNVEEAVILKNAMAGDWSVRVIGSNVPVGPQPFALVATGNLDGSYGRVRLDRIAYSESDTIGISVEDSDATSVVVHVASGIESAGEDVTLSGNAADATWRGSITTAFGSAAPDGVLQVREGDTITAVYTDASPPHSATARAVILASGPTIHDVTVTAISATSATVGWTTNEPATTEVRYGTSNVSLPFTANGSDLRTGHTITLTKLSADTPYYFDVTSRGRLGNATTDTNDGSGYRFQTSPLGDVLLVVGGESFPPEREASYAAALGGAGWTWSVWRVAELGLPPLGVLQARRAVIWQVGLEQYPPFNATARTLIQNYLDGGGRLIVSSHDTAWALTDALSPFATPQTAAWVHGVLKATFVCDPMSIGQVAGVTSDPISGIYTGGIVYTPHRDGGADDELISNAAGGTTASVWTDSTQVTGCTPPNQEIGLRWVSSSANGTAGVGAWGGTPSRLAYFAFEITSVDTTATGLNPTSPLRMDILNKTVRWLVSTSSTALDRSHPTLTITAPNNGAFPGPTIAVNWTANAFGTGISIANFTLASSADGGNTWTTIANLSGSARTYTWNIGTAPNGNRYLLRITAYDDGTPSLSGSDVTDGTFSIARPGGDTEGPLVWAGSVRVNPRPPGAALPISVAATADDRAGGASPVLEAELFLRTTRPGPAETGTGIRMSAADGAFDESVENLSWQGALGSPPGVGCVWVHAKDAAGNWGPYASLCFVVIFVGPDSVAPGVAVPDALRLTNGSRDLTIEWLASWDEGLYGGTVGYFVLRATSPRGPYANVTGLIPGNGSARYVFVDPGRGSNASDVFYRIETIDATNNTALSTTLAAKTRISFASGWNLLGMPVDLIDPVFGDLGAGRAWADGWTYEACTNGFRWSSALPTDATTFSLPAGRGFWLNGTASDSVVALGLVAQAAQVRLCAGWNLIALPGFAIGTTVHDLEAKTGAIRVMGFDAAGPYYVRDLLATDVIVSGIGYWVEVPADTTWTVAGW